MNSRDVASNVDHIPTKDVAKRWPHLKKLTEEIPERQNCVVGMLVGYDCSEALAPIDVIRGEGAQPYGVKTELGWSIVGKVTATEESISHHIMTMTIPEELTMPHEEYCHKEVHFVHHSTV